jgi:hypothetical protein
MGLPDEPHVTQLAVVHRWKGSMSNILNHPATALMVEVQAERASAATPEAEALVHAICKATSDYWEYLDQHGIIYDYERDLMRASALHVTYNGSDYDIVLKDGPIDRRYNGGEDPDVERRGLNPTWPP